MGEIQEVLCPWAWGIVWTKGWYGEGAYNLVHYRQQIKFWKDAILRVVTIPKS